MGVEAKNALNWAAAAAATVTAAIHSDEGGAARPRRYESMSSPRRLLSAFHRLDHKPGGRVAVRCFCATNRNTQGLGTTWKPMKIDVYSHILPRVSFDRLVEIALDKGAIKRRLTIPVLHDLDARQWLRG